MKSNKWNVIEPTYKTGTLKGRSSLIYFACIGVAPPQLFMRREQSRGSNSNAGKWIKMDQNEYSIHLANCND